MGNYKQIDCFDKNMKFWKFLGIYPLDISWKIYPYYSTFFVMAFNIVFVALGTANFYFIPRHLDYFVDELIFYFTDLAVTSKVLTFLFMKDKLKRVLDILESDMFQPVSEQGKKIMETAKKFNLRYWMIVMTVSVTANAFHVICPVLFHLLLKVDLELPVCSYSFLPDHIKETFIYPMYLYQSLSIHFNMQYNVNIDTFFLGLMIFVIAELKIIEERLRTVTEDFKEDFGIVSRDGVTAETKLILKLNKEIIHYDEVSKFCNLIEEVFSVTLFAQFSLSSCIICICLFRFTMPAPWQYFVFLATYMFVMIIQIMVPCWFGTRIMDQSCVLSQAIYNCDWTPTSKRFKSNMRLLVERANRPLAIVGWKMFPLSLVTFTSIMNTAYSFFTLLRHMQSN